MLKIQEFCKAHPDNYAEILEKDYAIKVKAEDGLVIFKYNQIKSDFSNEMVRECRGIILEEGTWNVVCNPMRKFGNYAESYVPVLDWTSSVALSKEDGSLIKLFYYKDQWHVATNGSINAFNAGIIPFYAEDWEIVIESFGQLFLYTLSQRYGITDFDFLRHKEWTHMFELCTPANKIVVKYNSPKVFYLVSKKNSTDEEYRFSTISKVVDNPKEYKLANLEDCIALVEDFGPDMEGIVVCDESFNRVKIKSSLYVNLHHMRGEGAFTEKRALDIVCKNEVEEVLTYFPEFKPLITAMKERYEFYLEEGRKFLRIIGNYSPELLMNRKMFAMQIKDSPFKDLGFQWLSNKVSTVEDYIEGMPTSKLLRHIYEIEISNIST